MGSMAALHIQALNNQIDNLLDRGDVIPILLSGAQVELPFDLHDKAGQVFINDVEVMDKIRLLRHLASVDEADDINE